MSNAALGHELPHQLALEEIIMKRMRDIMLACAAAAASDEKSYCSGRSREMLVLTGTCNVVTPASFHSSHA